MHSMHSMHRSLHGTLLAILLASLVSPASAADVHLGMGLRVSAEEYGPERDFDGTITRTITFSFKIAQQDD